MEFLHSKNDYIIGSICGIIGIFMIMYGISSIKENFDKKVVKPRITIIQSIYLLLVSIVFLFFAYEMFYN
jgi:uncharacterized membrane protein HdeD (DUF308 family)